MRENLMSGSRWQGMKTRHGDGTEALSEEMESNGSATPKSRRHPLTLPPDVWESARFTSICLASGFSYISNIFPARPPTTTDYLQCQGSEGKSFEAPVNHPRESLSLAVFFFFEPVFSFLGNASPPPSVFFFDGVWVAF